MRPAAPGSLRYSVLAGAAELGAAPLKQSSPFSAGFCVARRSTRGWKGVTILLLAPTQKIGLFFELTVTDAA